MAVLLSIDCGTQSLRALLFDEEGRLLAMRKVAYEPYVPGPPGRAEQDARVYWKALVEACRGLAAARPELMAAVAGVGVATQRDSMLCLDAEGEPLRPAILWLDQRKARPPWRPSPATRAGLALVGMGEAVARTQEEGKCNWIRQNEPAIWEATRKFTQVSGYLNHRLCGRFADSVASQVGHLPFDYRRQEWARPGSLNARMFPVEPDKLPDLVPAGRALGEITRAAAAETGIPAGVPLVAAGSDKGCETLGMGVVGPGRASLSFGTTATVQVATARYAEPLAFMPAYPAVAPGRYNPEVEIFRGYWMVTWFKRQFAYEEVREAEERGIEPEEALDGLLRRTSPGGHGLVMQPYWTPMLKMPAAKGAIIGFGDVHERAHVYRAIIEGLAYGLKEGLGAVERSSRARVSELAVSGGASRSDEICRITSDVFGLPLFRGATSEATGLGAAMATAAGVGLHPGVEEAAAAMSRRELAFEPDPRRSELYGELFERVYKRMYGALSPLYEEIRAITGYPEAAY